MRPLKKVLIYHPHKTNGAIFRYAMGVTLPIKVFLAASAAELNAPGDHIEVTVLWRKKVIELRNHHAKTFSTVARSCTNTVLMAATTTALQRIRGPRKSVPCGTNSESYL